MYPPTRLLVALAALLVAWVALAATERRRALSTAALVALLAATAAVTSAELPVFAALMGAPLGFALRAVRARAIWAAAMVATLGATFFAMDQLWYDAYGCRATYVQRRDPPPGPHGFEGWRAPGGVTHLVELQGVVAGAPPGGQPTVLDPSGWRVERGQRSLRVTSPLLDPPVRGLTGVKVAVAAAGASAVHVYLSHDGALTPERREAQGVTVPIDPDVADGVVEIEVDAAELLRGNWESDEDALARVEITVQGTDPSAARVERVALEGEAAPYQAAAAGVLTAEKGGVLRPSWFVHAGATARLTVDVPAGAELRWHDATVGDTGPRFVRVVEEGGARDVFRASAGGDWRHARLPLDAWAGRTVTFELATTERGVGLWGDPRVVVPGAAPNVIVYLVDTLRADHLGAWGSQSGATPTVDRLSREGAVFATAQSSSCWTKPAIPTLFSGLWETTHQVGMTGVSDRLPATVPLVQERFRAGGWRTGSFSASPLGSTLSGLERGFGTAVPPRHWGVRRDEGDEPSAGDLHGSLLAWWDEEPDLPIFAYVHTLEVHQYYELGAVDPLVGPTRYDRTVREMDDRLGELLAHLDATGRDVLLVLTSDHGESFYDHGAREHGTGLWQSQVHVPLVFWARGAVPPLTVTDPVGLADVAPTLLDLAGLPPIPAQGASLVPYLRGADAPVHAWVPSALQHYTWQPDAPQQFAGVDAERNKLVTVGDRGHFFDLARDPCERRSAPADGALAARLAAWRTEQEAAAAAHREAHGDVVRGGVKAGDVELLRALGYVE